MWFVFKNLLRTFNNGKDINKLLKIIKIIRTGYSQTSPQVSTVD